jgi:tetratricopeptide (TPR) repeat protein
MKRIAIKLVLPLIIFSMPVLAQNSPDYSRIDMMLIRGDYQRVVDTCRQILSADSLNSEIYFKMGIAYQNLLYEDKSLESFLKAASISPSVDKYTFTVAKTYFGDGKYNKALPLLKKLYAVDSLNWPYAYYLTGIYMQEGKYDESLKIYNRFQKADPSNSVYPDKIGFAYLQKDELHKATDMFSLALKLNHQDLVALKNLAYLYAGSISADTAVRLLTKGMSIDPDDMDLYARRASIYYATFNYKMALKDYLKLLSTGDSSVLYLKRSGIGFANNNQPEEAIMYLLKAYKKDSSDYEVVSYLAQNYMLLKEYDRSAYYYRYQIKALAPQVSRLGLNYFLLAEVLKSDKKYSEAISEYLKSQEYRNDNSVYGIIANLYDEKLKDKPQAIRYYELYLRKLNASKEKYDPDYLASIRKRIDSLKNNNVPVNHK